MESETLSRNESRQIKDHISKTSNLNTGHPLLKCFKSKWLYVVSVHKMMEKEI